jgi:hypothetical protein
VAISASHVAFADFLFNSVPRIPGFNHLGDAFELVTPMIKIKQHRVRLTAIYAGVFLKILADESS